MGRLRPAQDPPRGPRATALWLAALAVAAVGGLSPGGTLAADRFTALATVQSPCTAIVEKSASHEVLLRGETVDLALHFQALCAGEVAPLHVVIALDASDSLQGEVGHDVEDALTEFVRDLDLPSNLFIRVGVVAVSSKVGMTCALTNAEHRVLACLNRVQAGGASQLDEVIGEGGRVMRRGRLLERQPDDIREVLIVLSASADAGGCSAAVRAAAAVKRQGMLLIAICAGTDCDEACMRQLATSPRYYVRMEDFAAIRYSIDRIRRDILAISIRQVEIVDRFPAGITVFPETASPSASWNAVDRSVTWLIYNIGTDGITVTLRVQPERAGTQHTSGAAMATFIDNRHRVGKADFNSPTLWVLGEAVVMPTPVPSPGPPVRSLRP